MLMLIPRGVLLDALHATYLRRLGKRETCEREREARLRSEIILLFITLYSCSYIIDTHAISPTAALLACC
jgi:hypothetical protein